MLFYRFNTVLVIPLSRLACLAVKKQIGSWVFKVDLTKFNYSLSMRPMTTLNMSVKSWLPIIATTVIFYMAGMLTLPLSLPPSYATAIWPPAGIGLAAVLLWGNRVLPGIFVAELLIHYEVYDISALLASSPESAIYFLSPLNSVLRAWLGSTLVRKLAGFPNDLISTPLIILFFMLAGPVATFLPAVLSVYSLFLTGVIIKQDLVSSFLTWWLGDCAGIAVFTPLFFVVFNRRHRIWRQRLFSLGLPLVGIFILISAGYLFAQQKETERLHKLIDRRSAIIRDDLQHALQQHRMVLHLVKGLIDLPGSISEDNFQAFSRSILNQQTDIARLEWLEASGNKNDLSFISKYRADNKETTEFKSVAEIANGLAIGTRELIVTGKHEFMVCLPVFHTDTRLKGLVVGVINIKNFVGKAMDWKNYPHVVVKLFDGTSSAAITIFQSNDNRALHDPLNLTAFTTVNLAEHQWFLEIAPDQEFLSDHYSWSVWQWLAGGMVLASFMSIGLLVLTGHTEKVRSEVDKRTEELNQSNIKLAASEQQFRKLVQTQSAIVWRADPESFRFLFVSDEAESILGYPIDKWLNEADFWRQHIHEDDREAATAYCAEEIRNLRNYDFEYRMIAADGRCVWLRDVVHLIIHGDRVTEKVGFMIDITDQKKAEEQLRLAATTFESLQGIMITDKNARILRVNRAFTEITGYSAEQVEGQSANILKSGYHDQAFYDEFWRQLQTFGKFEGEIWNRRKNGEIYPEWQTVTAVKNDANEVSHYISVFSDITEQKEAANKIHKMAFYDSLTGLPNRRLLLNRFEHALAVARRHRRYGAVIFLDLDHFKLLNDSLGHQAGDELLIQVAARLSSVLRKEDTPARLGGDEFVILLHPDLDSLTVAADHAIAAAEKIRAALNQAFFLKDYQHQISTSIGIALFPDNHESTDIILQQADTAMYRSKASGRNTISFYHPSMQEVADLRINMENDLRFAIKQTQFSLYYQPLVDSEGVVLSAEALIRWRHPSKGTLLPIDFISIAEESSLILAIGQWVLVEACCQIKAWQATGVNLPHISINVSSRQFRQPDFVEQVRHALTSNGIAPYLLGIELTEGVMIDNINDTIAKMRALKALGVSIAMDDFGTGYSSLSYLKKLPIDILKIDRSFVRDILTDLSDAVIVETILGMAKHLGLHVIAEGVETAEQFNLLRQHECKSFQGHYFSPPLPAIQFAEKYYSLWRRSISL